MSLKNSEGWTTNTWNHKDGPWKHPAKQEIQLTQDHLCYDFKQMFTTGKSRQQGAEQRWGRNKNDGTMIFSGVTECSKTAHSDHYTTESLY